MTEPAAVVEQAPLLVVTDVAARLVRRGLITPGAAAGRWRRARVFVFQYGPVVCEPPPGTWSCGDRLSRPTFQPHR